MVSTFGNLDFNDNSDNVHRNNYEEDQNMNLLNDILDLCRYKRKRKGWINEDYYQLLKKIFSNYPSRHGDIKLPSQQMKFDNASNIIWNVLANL